MAQGTLISSESAQTDKRIDQLMGLLLRGGVILAASIVSAGGVIYLVRYPFPRSTITFSRASLKTSARFPGFQRAKAFHGRGLIQLGLLVLIATPIARVTFSVFCVLVRTRLEVCRFHPDRAGALALTVSSGEPERFDALQLLFVMGSHMKRSMHVVL